MPALEKANPEALVLLYDIFEIQDYAMQSKQKLFTTSKKTAAEEWWKTAGYSKN